VAPPGEDFWSRAAAEPPAAVREIAGFYPAQVALLGRRTAEFHTAMAAETEDPAFAPEPFTNYYQRSQYQALHYLQARTLQALQARLAELSPETRAEGLAVLDAAAEIHKRFLMLRDRKIESLRIRCHGNYHLGQVLYTGKDFMITDFEGDPGHSLSERRAKRSAMHDVASMLRSFHQAAYTAMLAEAEGTLPAGLKELEPWYRFWQAWVPVSFLHGYLEAAGKASFVPCHGEEASALLNVCLLEEMLTELRYELEHRPAWVRVPLQGILQLLRPAPPPLATA
jgi:maltose alpha-D-glucosyltransferase/alpha-amylase